MWVRFPPGVPFSKGMLLACPFSSASRRDRRNNVTRSALRSTIAVPSLRSLRFPPGVPFSKGMLLACPFSSVSRRDRRNNVTRSALRPTIAVPSLRSLRFPHGVPFSKGMLLACPFSSASRRDRRTQALHRPQFKSHYVFGTRTHHRARQSRTAYSPERHILSALYRRV